jgi:hypothetical protein
MKVRMYDCYVHQSCGYLTHIYMHKDQLKVLISSTSSALSPENRERVDRMVASPSKVWESVREM